MTQFRHSLIGQGATLVVGPTKCIVQSLDERGAVLAHLQTGELRWIGCVPLEALTLGARVNADGEFEVVELTAEEQDAIERIPVAMRSEATSNRGLSLLRWINGLKQLGIELPVDQDELAIRMLQLKPTLPLDTEQFTARTIHDHWRGMERNAGDARTVFPSFHRRGGPGVSRTAAEPERLLGVRLKQSKSESGPLRVVDIENAHVLDVTIANRVEGATPIEPLSKATINRRFHGFFTAYDVAVRNQGKRQADKRFRTAGARMNAQIPLLCAQFDDIDFGVYLVDERNGLPWGRAYLTSGVDEATESFLGAELSHRPRDAWSAISAVNSAIQRADMSLPQYALCKQALYAHGAIGTIEMDNALYNHGDQYIEGCIADAGAIPAWSQPFKPTNKQFIERFNGQVKEDFTPFLLGNRGKKWDVEGLKAGVASATCGLSLFAQMFYRWVSDDHANKPREDGLSTKQRWDTYFQGRSPLMPLDTPGYRLIGTLRGTLRFRASDGLLRLGLRYQSLGLSDLRKRLGADAEVQYRIHPYDLSSIYVFNPRLKVFLVAECIEPLDYIVGLTNYQQQLILKRCRENRRHNPSLLDMVAAREQLKVDVQQLLKSKKMVERRRGYRMDQESEQGKQPSSTPSQDAGVPGDAAAKQKTGKVIVMTDVERMIAELDEYELEPEAA